MKSKAKSRLPGIIFFWAAAIIPFLVIIMTKNFFGANWFVMSLTIYAVIYRPMLNVFRLLQLKRIKEQDAWKSFIPFHDAKYMKALWFG